MTNIDKQLQKQAEKFVKEMCIDTWGMSRDEVKNYCLMLIKQNIIMAMFEKDYMKTANAYKEVLKNYEN